MADPHLLVYYRARLVGRLSPEPLSFSYEQTWLDAKDAFPVSVALPLAPAAYPEPLVRSFFFNLLPEGGVRRRLAGALGISEGNDYALLAEIGGECAGALSVVKDPIEAEEEGEYEPLSDEDLAKRIASGGALSSAAKEEGVRLSLAGAQDKLPVYIDEDGTFLPKGPAPSSHILKFDNRDFKQLAVNEVMVLRLAEAVGLPTVRADLRRFGRSTAAVIERYDRVRIKGVIERVHQEDLCQALGIAAERKYQAEGGPSFARCVELVRTQSAEPLADAHAVIRWQLFNAAVGNADGHAKNLALLHQAGGTRLAPFYDLVSTRAYPRVERRLAMGIGENSDPDALTKKDWTRFASDLRVGERYVRDTARELVEAVQEALEPTLRAFEKAFGKKDFLRSSVVPAIQRSSRRLALSLKS